VLQSLNKYIEYQPANGASSALRRWFTRERRFAVLLASSIILHLIFYVGLILLNSWAMRQIKPNRSASSSIAVITEIAPPPARYELRSKPESLERVDPSQLHYDPENTDDTHMLSRSPKPSIQRGNNGPLLSAAEIERQAKGSRGTGKANSPVAPPLQSQPPTIASAPPSRTVQSDVPLAPSVSAAPPAPAPPAVPTPKTGSGNVPDATSAGVRRGDGAESTAFGMQQIQAQYIAHVRAKISKMNEAIMPRNWIETVLNNKVGAEYVLTLRRDGGIQSLHIFNSCGYRVLDDTASKAIYSASPYEGFPPNAGETLTLRVTVYYTPSR
jgi:outer membrane biosynthesis protein TonB